MRKRFYKTVLLFHLMLVSSAGVIKAQDKLDSIAHFIKTETQVRGIPGLQIAIVQSGKIIVLKSN